jgi:hydroxypyruvate isomerase
VGETHALRYAANCTLLFHEWKLLERPARAKAAGFDTVELWWPFDSPTPPGAEVDALTRAIEDAGVALVALNLYGGDLHGPDAGVLSIPSRAEEFRASVPIAAKIADRLGVTRFNALYGARVAGIDPGQQDTVALASLVFAAESLAEVGGTILVEPISGPKPVPIRTASDAIEIVERVRLAGHSNVGMLCDLYHLASNGDDIYAAIAAYASEVAHVQIADAPGRGEPGTGTLPLDDYLVSLELAGYRGLVSLEYNPTVSTLESLAFLPRDRRATIA